MNEQAPSTPMSLPTLFDDLYVPQRLGQAADSTVRQFHITFRKMATFLGREATLDDLNDETVAAFILWRHKVQGSAAPTANKSLDNLLALWRFLHRKGMVSRWPEVRKLSEPARVPRAWSRRQLESLFNACEAERGYIGLVPAGLWWHGLHCVLWDTGERIGAIMLARWEHLDTEERWLAIPAETRKCRLRDRIYRLHPSTVDLLGRIRPHIPEETRLFPWPCDAGYLWMRYGVLLRRAGLPCDRKSKFHRMRKSTASWFEAAGGNATSLLDHSSRKVTEAYLDPTIVVQPQATDMLFRPLQPTSQPDAIAAAPKHEPVAPVREAVAEVGPASQTLPPPPIAPWSERTPIDLLVRDFESNYASNTAAILGQRLRFMLAECGFGSLGSITDGGVRAFLDHMTREGRAEPTIESYLSALRCFLRWLATERGMRGRFLEIASVARREAAK